MARYLAIDLGAESGRVILGTLHAGILQTDELHRFANGPVRRGRSLRWDVGRLFREVRVGLRRAAAHAPIRSVACDSWGVDYVLLKRSGPPLAPPYSYRDERTFAAFARVLGAHDRAAIFAGTGIGFFPINTLYQLADDVEHRPGMLRRASRLLLIGDYMTWLLSGKARGEETLISGSQCWDTRTRAWAWPILRALGIPKHLFPRTVPPGTRMGPLLPAIAQETGLRQTQVIATCAHDTAAAVAAIPASGRNWAFLSSGTWSLLGAELPRPLVNSRVLAANFTNETGFGGTTRLLKCLVGLWILQECRREWAPGAADYARIVRLACRAPALCSLIRPDDLRFAKAGDMTRKVQAYCRETGQPIPRSHGAIARCIFESLALLYGEELRGLERLTKRKIRVLHIVGGGSQNALLNQLTADALQRRVVAGPVEATAAGNILVQAIAMKELAGLAELRAVVRRSFALTEFHPRPGKAWQAAHARFALLPRAEVPVTPTITASRRRARESLSARARPTSRRTTR